MEIPESYTKITEIRWFDSPQPVKAHGHIERIFDQEFLRLADSQIYENGLWQVIYTWVSMNETTKRIYG
jgi:hypothetical protein